MTKFEEFEEVIARLRAPDGCPWDRAQTHMSLKKTCIEEAAEVICGINILDQTGDADNLKEELGDLLMQVVLHARIAEEEGLFTMDDVIQSIIDKMVRRHPHVFGDSDGPGTAQAPTGLRKAGMKSRKKRKPEKNGQKNTSPKHSRRRKNLSIRQRSGKDLIRTLKSRRDKLSGHHALFASATGISICNIKIVFSVLTVIVPSYFSAVC